VDMWWYYDHVKDEDDSRHTCCPSRFDARLFLVVVGVTTTSGVASGTMSWSCCMSCWLVLIMFSACHA
jgi:hypothetical protein